MSHTVRIPLEPNREQIQALERRFWAANQIRDRVLRSEPEAFAEGGLSSEAKARLFEGRPEAKELSSEMIKKITVTEEVTQLEAYNALKFYQGQLEVSGAAGGVERLVVPADPVAVETEASSLERHRITNHCVLIRESFGQYSVELTCHGSHSSHED